MIQRYPYAEYRKLAQQLLSTKLVPMTLALFAVLFTLPSAQAASCKIPKSYYKNVACSSSSGYYLASKDFGAPVALIDSKGKPVVDLLRYQKVAADKIASGLIPVQRNNRVGYINMQGREVIPIMYDALKESGGWARAASEGRIIVKKDGNYGVINTSGKIIVPFSSAFSDIDNYRNSIAQVRKNKATSWLDKNGNAASDPNSATIDNATKVTNKTDLDKQVSTVQSVAKSASFTTLQPAQQDGKWGFVDERNTIMITYSFDEVRPFSEGLAAVRIEDNWGFVNLGGELVIPFNFENPTASTVNSEPMFVFKEGKAWTGTLKSGDKVCIDQTGNLTDCDIVKALDKKDSNLLSEISDISEVSEINEINEISEIGEIREVSAISEINEINEVSEINEISEISEISEVNAVSAINEINEISEISESSEINKTNEIDKVSEISKIDEVNETGEVREISASRPVKDLGSITTTSVVSKIMRTAPESKPIITLKPAKQDGKWGFVDEQKTIVIAYTFDEVRPFFEDLAGVRVDNKWGFIDLKGEVVIPLSFAHNTVQDNENLDAMFVFNNEKAWIGTLQNGDKLCIDKVGNKVSCE